VSSGKWQFGTGEGALCKYRTSEPEQFCRTPPGVLTHVSGFLDKLLLFYQAAEILLVEETPCQGFHAALQLQQRECVRHQFEHHRCGI